MASLDNKRTSALREFVLEHVEAHPQDIATFAAGSLGVSRQFAHRQIAALVREGVLDATGRTKARRYSLAVNASEAEYDVTPTLEEHVVWDDFAHPLLEDLPRNVVKICSYGFTEMVNNVIDHSESGRMQLSVTRSRKQVELIVSDAGVGIFNKVQAACHLESPREAIFELTKGKFTTDPKHHTGEGLFFTSRMFDRFSIMSGTLFLTHSRAKRDWLLETRLDPDSGRGTTIFMSIDPGSTHTDQEIFEQYSRPQDDYAFNKTTLALEFASEEPLVSRSQAKRILTRVDRFKEVLLDFRNVDSIGPAFADEIFRVFSSEHSDVSLIPINANEEVQKMIMRSTPGRTG